MKFVSCVTRRKITPGTILWLTMVLWFVLVAGGCSKITQENYGKIKVGMEYGTVVEIIGDPANCSSVFNATKCTWGNATRSIDISFVAEKVVFFSGKGL